MRWTVSRLAVAGTAASTLTVVAGGRSGTATTTPPTTWLGLLSPTGYRPGGAWLFGALTLGGLVLLVLAWMAVVSLAARGALSERAAWRLAVAWAMPFVLGPPLISKDVYAYAADGMLLRHGLNVYRSGVSALAGLHTGDAARGLAAVDPTWRGSRSPYGPLASTIERAAAQLSGGHPVMTVVVLRIVAVVAVAALVWLAASLATGHRAMAVVCVGLNPLVLAHAVSGAHLEAVMAALLVAGLAAARQRRWVLAVVLVCAAGAVKAPAYAALPALMVVHARHTPTRRWRPIADDLLVATLSSIGYVLLVSDGLGWVRNLATPTHNRSATSISAVISIVLHRALPMAWSDTVSKLVTLSALAAAAGIVGWLAVTSGRRPLAASVGFGLLGLAALTPVFYPWYLLWGVVCLLPASPPRRRDWLVALCGVATLAALTGLPSWATTTADLVPVLAAAVWLRRRSLSGSRARAEIPAHQVVS